MWKSLNVVFILAIAAGAYFLGLTGNRPPEKIEIPTSESSANSTPTTAKISSSTKEDIPVNKPIIGNSESIKTYISNKRDLFPASPVAGLTIFVPQDIDGSVVLGSAQLNMTIKELKEVSQKTLVKFLVNFVGMIHRFNCDNYGELLDAGISIFNVLTTREGNRSPELLPAISFQGEKLVLSQGFATVADICSTLDKKEGKSLLIKPATSSEKRLLDLLRKQGVVGSGTGWPLENGLIVTNQHVVAPGVRFFVVRSDRAFVEARVLLEDPQEDLALLYVDDEDFLPHALKLAPESAQLGEDVFTMGYPWTSQKMNIFPEIQVTKGIVSSFPSNGKAIQLSMPVQSGNSGGPLLNRRGEVVGVIVSKLLAENEAGDKPENVSYAIKLSRLERLLRYISKDVVNPVSNVNDSTKDLDDIVGALRPSVLLVVTF